MTSPRSPGTTEFTFYIVLNLLQSQVFVICVCRIFLSVCRISNVQLIVISITISWISLGLFRTNYYSFMFCILCLFNWAIVCCNVQALYKCDCSFILLLQNLCIVFKKKKKINCDIFVIQASTDRSPAIPAAFANPLALLLWLPCARHCLDPEAVLLLLGAAVRTESPRVGGRAVSERIGNGDQGQWDDAFEALMVCSPLTSK